LGYENISVGYWTLCIEIQFYMLFVVMLGVAQYLSQRYTSFSHAASLSGTAQDVRSNYPTSPKSLITVFAPVMFASLFTFTYFEQLDDWFLRYYCLFCLGACLSACRNNMLPKAIAWVALGLFAIRIAIEFQRGVFCGLAVGLLIMLADYRNALNSWLMSRTWQYLGKISYSLYLIHYPVAHLIMHLGKRFSGDNVTMIYVWMTISLFASVAAAALLFRIVEAPSLALAQRFGNRPSKQNAQETQVAHEVLIGEELDSIQLANRIASPANEPVLESQSV
jgi:peptidoglycan/LPS O-acetylase OafA/YrhL